MRDDERFEKLGLDPFFFARSREIYDYILEKHLMSGNENVNNIINSIIYSMIIFMEENICEEEYQEFSYLVYETLFKTIRNMNHGKKS